MVLLWGVVGLLDVRKRQREFRDWRQRRWAPKSPHEKEPNIGRPPDRNPLFRDREADLERLAVQLAQIFHRGPERPIRPPDQGGSSSWERDSVV